jgi:hypothetical protein
MEKLQAAVNQHLGGAIMLSLTPSQHLVHTCGFPANSVPPMGLCPSPQLIFVEESLQSLDTTNTLMLAGGGRPRQSLLVSLDVVLKQQNPYTKQSKTLLEQFVHVAHFREDDTSDSEKAGYFVQPTQVPSSSKKQLEMPPSPITPKPFFVVAPPLLSQVEEILLDDNGTVPWLEPEWVSFVGTITAVRQMAKLLVFVDIAPPTSTHCVETTNLDTDPTTLYPWRNPNTKGDMAVQLIIGKTFCQRHDGDSGVAAPQEILKQLKTGQWIFVQGKTNVGNKDSLRNWYNKNSLDVVVFDFEWIQGQADDRRILVAATRDNPTKSILPPQQPAILKPTLTWNDFYPREASENEVTKEDLNSIIQLVESMDTLFAMKEAITGWLLQHPRDFGLVGIDSEWKPNFLTEDDDQAQPVLVLQICFHPLGKIYLLDLQTLLRPMELPTESMNEKEQYVSEVLHLIFSTKRFIKVGFQVLNDLQKLAASYSHVHAFEPIDSILETSKFAMKVFQMTQVKNSRRLATSSLNTLTESLFRGKVLDKTQQISDWSQRPLTEAQKDYAAMDAAVVVAIANRLMQSVGATILLEEEPTASANDREKQFFPAPTANVIPLLGRFENDAAFDNMLVSVRFLFLDAAEDHHAVQRLRAKSHIGSSSSSKTLVATQTWNTRSSIPDIPTFASDSTGIYTDLQGATRVPSRSLEIDPRNLERFQKSIGTRVAKSKSGCVLSLLEGHSLLEDDNVVVDFPQRSGYVELQNAVILFVTLPMGAGNKRSYPNEWLEDGSVLSWFLRENDWNNGQSCLAKKMMDHDGAQVILFVRRGKGHFLNCGRCRVALGFNNADASNDSNVPATTTRDGKLVKLFLLLQDWVGLYPRAEFLELM